MDEKEISPGCYYLVRYGTSHSQLAFVMGRDKAGRFVVEKFSARSNGWKRKCDPMPAGDFLRAATTSEAILTVGARSRAVQP